LLNHRDFQRREDLDQQIVQTLRQYEVEWVIMAGWMRLVTPVLIDAFPDQIINIHPSLLPSFRASDRAGSGCRGKITGCTVHIVCLEWRPNFAQAAVPVLPTIHQKRFMPEFKSRNTEFCRQRLP